MVYYSMCRRMQRRRAKLFAGRRVERKEERQWMKSNLMP